MTDSNDIPERMREIALDLPVPDDMTNREYWLRTEIMQWADAYEALEQRVAFWLKAARLAVYESDDELLRECLEDEDSFNVVLATGEEA